ncbi:FAD-binding oxidoreductase [Martelella alba]|uniref:FAD-binding oxidoreductase n=1 Tax=Martelella alba TaxID=2590451 RepID=A0A506UE29_9HYPH|nr:FAD-binding oxidoreductase [Martelella alba]TPW31646.1 FAD-binding oxidoreductase [Martelella alba]
MTADLVIVGGGIMGLWAAYHAEKAGIETLVVDAGTPGHGASNGLVGVLMAYMPDLWDEKKQFQFDALLRLERDLAMLSAETGIETSYRRSGRIMPINSERQRNTALARQEEARINWKVGDRRFRFDVLEDAPVTGWPAARPDRFGYIFDDLAAHVFPRDVVTALLAFLADARHVRIMPEMPVTGIDTAGHAIRLADGGTIGFGSVIIAAGTGAFPLMQPHLAPEGRALGRGVKGQAALMAADLDPGLPILYDEGLYVVPHSGGRVAIGSTSEDRFADPSSTDQQLEALIAAARLAVPALADAPVIERWAGLRPRAIARDPVVGALPGLDHVIALAGGFKTSFGLAHVLAEHAVLTAAGNVSVALPLKFHPKIHHDWAMKK